jgi:hypothetical protein
MVPVAILETKSLYIYIYIYIVILDAMIQLYF